MPATTLRNVREAGKSVCLAIEIQQIIARAGTRIKKVATVVNGFIGERGKNGFGHAPIAQTRLDIHSTVQLAHALCWIASAE